MWQPGIAGTIQALHLSRFRNHRDTSCEFAPGLNLFQGRNGQGKTNVLEAIHYLAILRSFRTRQTRDLIQWGADGFGLKAELHPVESGLPMLWLEAAFGKQRSLSIHGAPIAKGSDFIHRFLCVAFIPEDIELVRGSSAERRRFIDILVSQLDPGYLGWLHRFQVALKSRNAILRGQAGSYDLRSRQVYERLLVEAGAELVVRRCLVLRLLERQLTLEASAFFHGETDIPAFALRYEPGVTKLAAKLGNDADWTPTEVAAALDETLTVSLDRDLREGQTSWGPQRDDIGLTIGDRPLAAFGSEGQCRAMALLLRLAAAKLLQRQNKGLVLLVDDVLGELDLPRRTAFWELLPTTAQIFFTCTEVPPEAVPRIARCFRVDHGGLTNGS